MIIALFIIPVHPLLNALLRHVQRDMNFAVRGAVRRQNAQLHGVERVPRVAAGDIREKNLRVLVNHCVVGAHAPLFVIDRAPDQFPHIVHGERPQFKNHRPRDQRAVDFKIRILGSCADQGDRSVLDKGQQIVLLAFVEAVNLVDKENRLLTVAAPALFRRRDHLLHILFAGGRRVDLNEFRTGGIGDDPGQRGFARSGRAVKQDASQLVRLDSPVEQLVPADDVLLPHDLVDRAGPEPRGQRRLCLLILFVHVFK